MFIVSYDRVGPGFGIEIVDKLVDEDDKRIFNRAMFEGRDFICSLPLGPVMWYDHAI